jgi:hypothetical protein
LLSVSIALRHVGERSTNVSFTEAEMAQGGEGLGLRLDATRLDHLAVVAAVSVLEANAPGHTAGDPELAAVCCPVMRTAQSDEIVGIVAATLGAELEVMKI